jgi:hypothetical protein
VGEGGRRSLAGEGLQTIIFEIVAPHPTSLREATFSLWGEGSLYEMGAKHSSNMRSKNVSIKQQRVRRVVADTRTLSLEIQEFRNSDLMSTIGEF